MSTELKPFKALNTLNPNAQDEQVSMTSFYGGKDRGRCVQLTCSNRREGGFHYMQFTREQALEAAEALLQFANETREEENG